MAVAVVDEATREASSQLADQLRHVADETRRRPVESPATSADAAAAKPGKRKFIMIGALGLLHGACPAAMILCHQEGRTELRMGAAPPLPLPALTAVRDAAEAAAAWVRPARVIGVALDTSELGAAAALAACEQRGRELGVPATDTVRHGAEGLAEAVLAAAQRSGRAARAASPAGQGQGRTA